MYMPENEERPMSRELVTELQTLLNAQGVDAGEPDGILGSRTRAAVRAYQEQANLPTDGYPSFELLEQLREL
jgi:membrane-bound lytic murein transglycosylase B